MNTQIPSPDAPNKLNTPNKPNRGQNLSSDPYLASSDPYLKNKLQQEFHQHLIEIADWWLAHTVDHERDGFYGEVSADNTPNKNASKGIILNARILWFFSAAARQLKDSKYENAATRAFEYLSTYFFDLEYGGVYWELDADGKPINTKKQVYAHAFVIYALTEYFQLTQDDQALALALNCFDLIEEKSIDREREGYLEAFTREWGTIEDLRLSDKDLNYPKSQNTHLHILEAYTTLNQINPTPEISTALKYTIEMFDKYMIDRSTYHLRMFMDLDWKDYSPGYTYGHDIEASWLLTKALESLGDEEYTQALVPTLLRVAETTFNEGIGQHGQVLDAYDFATQKVSPDTVWWVQAEALVGFLFAYSQTGDKKYFLAATNLWKFIKQHQIDNNNGEWLWLSNLDAQPEKPNYKVGFWKCPYHNGRAMIEAANYLKMCE